MSYTCRNCPSPYRVSKSLGTLASMVRRNFGNSVLRWRRCNSPITAPVAMSSAAKSVVVPWRMQSCVPLLGYAGGRQRDRLRKIQSLNLDLLIHAQHYGFERRRQIQPDDVAHFLEEYRIAGELERAFQYVLVGPSDLTSGFETHRVILSLSSACSPATCPSRKRSD